MAAFGDGKSRTQPRAGYRFDHKSIHPSGLLVVPNFVSRKRAKRIITYLDTEGTWITEFKARRQQFYGSRYHALSGTATKPAPAMAGPILEVAKRIERRYGIVVDHCIVNEYGPTGSIGAHTDSDVYGEHIFGLSLVDHGSLEFTRDGYPSYHAYLPRRSLMIMEGAARWKWKHALKPTKSYPGAGGEPIRKGADYRRISLTFRYKAKH